MMRGLGTIINAFTIIAGGVLGIGGHLTFVAKAILNFIIVLIMASSMGNPYACRFGLL